MLEVANEEPAPLIAAELDNESVVPSLVSVSISPTASRLIVSNPLEKLVVTSSCRFSSSKLKSLKTSFVLLALIRFMRSARD